MAYVVSGILPTDFLTVCVCHHQNASPPRPEGGGEKGKPFRPTAVQTEFTGRLGVAPANREPTCRTKTITNCLRLI